MRERYVVRGFLDDIAAALVAADLAVSRAGASSLGELPARSLEGPALPDARFPGE